MPPKVPAPFVVNKKLVLHFELHNVITFLPAHNRSREEQIFEMAIYMAWGSIQKKDEKSPSVWKLQFPSLSKTQPEGQVNLITYKNFLEQQYPSSPENAKVVQELTLNFTKGPGAKLKSEIEKLLKSISVPKPLLDALKADQDLLNHNPTQIYKQLVQNHILQGKYQILPSFFKLLLFLKKAKKEFAVVIHAPSDTKEHEDIIGELNLFFTGEHPCYNGKNGTPLVKMDGSKGTHNYKIVPRNTGVIYRFDNQPFLGDCCTFGTLKQYQEKDVESLGHKLVQAKAQTRLCQSSQIYSYSRSILKESAAMYIIDPLHLMVYDPIDYNTQEIYFHPVDREIHLFSVTGETLAASESLNSVSVDMFQLLRDVDFFIKEVENAEKNRLLQIERIEKPQNSVQEAANNKLKAEQLQSLSDADYLKQTIFPLLDGALRQVDIERPEDPVAFIALYCLRNKHRMKKVEPRSKAATEEPAAGQTH